MMKRNLPVTFFHLLLVGLCLTTPFAYGQGTPSNLTAGPVELQSVSQLAFGPDGILFVGDSLGGAVFAIDTEDTEPATSPVRIEIQGINEKIASLLGTRPDQILINDFDVNPLSQKVYLAVSRGRGPDGIPVILSVDASGRMLEFSLDRVRHSKMALANPAESRPDAPDRNTPEGPRSGNPRVETITDMSYVDGKLVVAGLSNEDFASDLRVFPFPFENAERGSGIRIWHSAHGRYETAAPVRTFVPYMINNEQHILASYTCTPLVKIPLSDLRPGAKVLGTTIAELGNNNRPLEMFTYRSAGRDYILMANSKRGVMKVSTEDLGSYGPITPPTAACEESSEPGRGPSECQGGILGVPYETVTDLVGVWQMAKLDDNHALVLADRSGSLSFVAGNASSFTPEPGRPLDLKTVPLP